MDQYLRLHRLLRRIQQRNKFLNVVSDPPVTLLEMHVLIELQASGSALSMKELSGFFKIDQSSISRLISRMEERDLLRKAPEKVNGVKQLALTERGLKCIEENDSAVNTDLKKFLLSISRQEQDDFIELVHTLADYFDVPRSKPRPVDSPFRLAQRRITRALGLLGSDVHGSGMTSFEWNVLAEIVLSPCPMQTVELAQALEVPQNSLSALLKKLETQNLISRNRSELDKRIIFLRSTEVGTRFYSDLEQKAADVFKRALSSYGHDQLRKLVDIVSLYAGDCDGTLPRIHNGVEVVPLTDENLKKRARGFIAKMLVAHKKEEELPETILTEDQSGYLVMYKEKELLVLFSRIPLQAPSTCIWAVDISPYELYMGLHAILLVNRCTADELPHITLLPELILS